MAANVLWERKFGPEEKIELVEESGLKVKLYAPYNGAVAVSTFILRDKRNGEDFVEEFAQQLMRYVSIRNQKRAGLVAATKAALEAEDAELDELDEGVVDVEETEVASSARKPGRPRKETN